AEDVVELRVELVLEQGELGPSVRVEAQLGAVGQIVEAAGVGVVREDRDPFGVERGPPEVDHARLAAHPDTRRCGCSTRFEFSCEVQSLSTGSPSARNAVVRYSNFCGRSARRRSRCVRRFAPPGSKRQLSTCCWPPSSGSLRRSTWIAWIPASSIFPRTTIWTSKSMPPSVTRMDSRSVTTAACASAPPLVLISVAR